MDNFFAKSREVGSWGLQWVAVGSKLLVVDRSGSPQKLQINKTKTSAKTKQVIGDHGVPQSADYFQRKLDDKRRLTIPTNLRSEFATGYVITQGFGNYLHLYPKQIWDQQVEPALKGSILDEQVADINVKFRMGKSEGDIDQKQGRITVEKHQLEAAGIKDEVVAVRAGNYWRLMPMA